MPSHNERLDLGAICAVVPRSIDRLLVRSLTALAVRNELPPPRVARTSVRQQRQLDRGSPNAGKKLRGAVNDVCVHWECVYLLVNLEENLGVTKRPPLTTQLRRGVNRLYCQTPTNIVLLQIFNGLSRKWKKVKIKPNMHVHIYMCVCVFACMWHIKKEWKRDTNK